MNHEFHGVTIVSYKTLVIGLTIRETRGKIAMGEEIASSHFRKQDFREFQNRLEDEMILLRKRFAANDFDAGPRTGGFELEAWLIDQSFGPAAINGPFLDLLNNPMVVPELSAFNVELNTEPQSMGGKILSRMQQDLEQTWKTCRHTAAKLDADLLMIGILPTVQECQLALSNMSKLTRYRALNEQILRLRRGEALQLDISGRELLNKHRHDVMLEAAATSFQIHLKMPPQHAVRYFNAAIVLSAPMVAVSANSPYLFGADLWDETRIPLFEQAVSVASAKLKLADRVTFGKAYANHSLLEFFEENLNNYSVLLPDVMDASPEELSHVRLHNGTIWRWNRPLIGFDQDGRPHLRIEHRVVPAGPSIIDTIANAAFFYGLVHMLATQNEPPESCLPFETARANFYAAAKNSLNSKLVWIDGKTVPMHGLLQDVLLPMARQGLQEQDFDAHDIDTYMNVIDGRLRSRCNGTSWQRAWVTLNGNDMQALTRAYAEQQHTGKPVHEWPISKI